MRKLIVIFLLVSLCLAFNSCSLVFGKPAGYYDSDETTDARLNQAIEAINNKDKDALKAMFSKQALNEADDFDGKADDLFGFVQKKIISWDRIEHASGGGHYKYGHRTIRVDSYYYIYTGSQKYFLHMIDYPVDTDHPDNVGLYMLQVIKAEDEHLWAETPITCAGISIIKE